MRPIVDTYDALARVSPSATVIHQNGRILLANDVAAKRFRAETHTSLVGADLADLVPPSVLAESGSVPIDYHGEPAVITFLSNVTPQEADPPSTSQETRYRTMFDHSPTALWEEDFSEPIALLREIEQSGVTDMRAYLANNHDVLKKCLSLVRLVDVNQTACDLYGAATKAELMGSLSDIVAPEAVEHAIDGLLAMLSGASTYRQETLNLRLDGSIMNVRLRWRLSQKEDYSRVLVLVEDVTHEAQVERALRESEVRYRTLVEMSPDAIVVQDGTTILYANAATAQIANIPDATLLMGQPWAAFVTHQGADKLAAQIAKSRANGRTQDAAILDLTFTDGTVHKIEATGMPIVYGGKPAVQTVLRDVTDRLHVQDMLAQHKVNLEKLVSERTSELLETNKELEQATRAKSAFLASMSHELRTPLNSIIGFSGVLLQGLSGPLAPEQERQIKMVNRSGRQLLDLISDVLDLSKIESGRVEIEAKPVEVRRHIENLIDTVRPMAAEKGLDLYLEFGNVPTSITTDKQKLEQIVLNLLANAIKYTDRGAVTVRVDKTDSQIMYSVSDTGVGIAGEDHDTVFEEFRQLQTMATAKHPGTGLGLPIARRLAGLLGGTISLSSTPGKGSTFSLVLPLVAAASDAA